MNYRKLRKLLKTPHLFFIDYLNKKHQASADDKSKKSDKKVTFAFGFNLWKRDFLQKYYPEREFIYIPINTPISNYAKICERLASFGRSVEIFSWGMKLPLPIQEFAIHSSIPIYFMEDGFIRSVRLGVEKAWPRSLCIDGKANHFEYNKPTDLENILSTYDFENHKELVNKGKYLIEKIIENNISKYNNSMLTTDIESLYGKKNAKRVLVIGQIESDASISQGSANVKNNFELLKIACDENPGAQIIYKEHPDILIGKQKNNSDMEALRAKCWVLLSDIPLSQAFHEVDHVYTITSLSGIEALIRGIKVTTLGCPFYSGWGLTDDRQINPRRGRKLTIDELITGAYILYPKYFNPNTGAPCSAENTIDEIIAERADHHKELQQDTTEQQCFILRPILKDENTESSSDTSPQVESLPEKAKTDDNNKNKVERRNNNRNEIDNVPEWFNPSALSGIKQITSDRKVFLYIPWHDNNLSNLIELIKDEKNFLLQPFDFANDIMKKDVRVKITTFARSMPDVYRRIIISTLSRLQSNISGVIFDNDISPATRLIANVCEELDIPRILIPSTNIGFNKDRYYLDLDGESQSSLPIADIVLGLNDTQHDIFISRGYDDNRFRLMNDGTPTISNKYTNTFSSTQFNRLYSIDSGKTVILFIAQNEEFAESQENHQTTQREIIKHLLDYTTEHQCHLIIRLPESSDNILGIELTKTLMATDANTIDYASYYLSDVSESIYHSDIIISIDYNDIIKALAFDKKALYINTSNDDVEDSICPTIYHHENISSTIDEIISNSIILSDEIKKKVTVSYYENNLHQDVYDSIRQTLTVFDKNDFINTKQNSAINRVFKNEVIDIVGIPSAEDVFDSGTQKYLKNLINARTLISTWSNKCALSSVHSVELFLQWGISHTTSKARQKKNAGLLSRPVLILEDGFIRSIDIRLSGTPGLSIIMDDTTAYYDATKESRLNKTLQKGRDLSVAEIARARNAIEKIVTNKISKYNHAQCFSIKIGEDHRKKILLIDQRFGDQSVTSGLADEFTFERMLNDAIANHPECDIIIKQHPDAIKGGKSSYYSDERLAFTKYVDNVYTVNFDINPYCLLDLVEEVYVVTSGMGFEALMAGKKVHCYGMPFYAGWGVTEDQIQLPSRTRKRSLEEVFYFSYIEASRYFDPDLDKQVQVEEIVDYIVKHRKW